MLARALPRYEQSFKNVTKLPISKEAWVGVTRLEELAKIYALTGEPDAAIDILEDLLRRPTFVSVQLLAIDPTWKPLNGHPRFREPAVPRVVHPRGAGTR